MSGTLIVSLDFELFWGMLDQCPLEEYRENVLGGRAAIPRLLELFERHGIHATWATVGFMFAENYEELKQYLPAETLRPTYQNKALSPYGYFETIGKNEEEAPCFYGASLIRKIAETKGQEIGTHTFSHYYCREEGQNALQFQADLQAALAIASAHGYTLTSAILPRNQTTSECASALKEAGITVYRSEEDDWIHRKVKCRPLMRILRLLDVYLPLTGQGGYHPQDEDGILNVIGSRMYKPYFKKLAFLEGLKLRRIKKQMLHAAKKGLTFHLWWHPHNIGVQTELHFRQLEEIFSYYDYLKEKYQMQSMNMGEARCINSTMPTDR